MFICSSWKLPVPTWRKDECDGLWLYLCLPFSTLSLRQFRCAVSWISVWRPGYCVKSLLTESSGGQAMGLLLCYERGQIPGSVAVSWRGQCMALLTDGSCITVSWFCLTLTVLEGVGELSGSLLQVDAWLLSLSCSFSAPPGWNRLHFELWPWSSYFCHLPVREWWLFSWDWLLLVSLLLWQAYHTSDHLSLVFHLTWVILSRRHAIFHWLDIVSTYGSNYWERDVVTFCV